MTDPLGTFHHFEAYEREHRRGAPVPANVRAVARELRSAGKSTRLIGHTLGVCHSTVVRWTADMGAPPAAHPLYWTPALTPAQRRLNNKLKNAGIRASERRRILGIGTGGQG